jgi:hypothetical protein
MHSLGSKPPGTPLLESAQVPFDSVRILLAKSSVDLTRACSIDWVRRFYLEPADCNYLTCFSDLDSGACTFLFLLTQSLADKPAAVDPRLPY